MPRRWVAPFVLASLVTACATAAGEPAVPSTAAPAATTIAPPTATPIAPPIAPPTAGPAPAPAGHGVVAASSITASSIETSPGIATAVYRPDAATSGPAVVLVPGGAWRSADPESLRAIALSLAGAGATVYLTTYDLDAATAFAQVACVVAVAEQSGASNVVLAGHSAGAQITAVVALGGDAFSPVDGCVAATYRPPVAWVGISGPYEIRSIDAIARLPALERFVGGTPTDDPGGWDLADPYGYVDAAPGLDITLVHGRTDIVAFALFTERFAAALTGAGGDPRTVFIDGADHDDVLDPADAGATTIDLILDAVRRVV